MSISIPALSPRTPQQQQQQGALPPVLHIDTPAETMDWLARKRGSLLSAIAEHGAVLVRGMDLHHPAQVGNILHCLGLAPMTEREAFTPRQGYANGVYSSAKWPPNQPMCMHHELSYADTFPSVLLFACLSPPTVGGATALADSAAVLDALPSAVSERFAREGWLLARSYGNDIGASLAESFGTDDREEIEDYCRAHAITLAWQPDGTLVTRQRRPAVLRHPVTGRICWFNQIAFLNEWTIDPEVRAYLLAEYGPNGLPFNTFHGNGDSIPPETVGLINSVYEAHTVRRPWEAGDLLIVDNLRTAHSREAFQGPREVVVAMGAPLHSHDCAPTIEVSSP
ncbi:TauD/TfdA family dioxygenase [Streptomyces sp. NPDC058525]|uniref:TauD/TfdA family dioxygenase n=1 Tax=Streptomyces sp. NPDC058525 TaxID=3346538 RepID=UPI00365F7C28